MSETNSSSAVANLLRPLFSGRNVVEDAAVLGMTSNDLQLTIDGGLPVTTHLAMEIANLLAIDPRAIMNAQVEQDLIVAGATLPTTTVTVRSPTTTTMGCALDVSDLAVTSIVRQY